MRKTLSMALALLLALTVLAGFTAPKASAAAELTFYDINSTAARMAFFEKVFDEYYEETGIRFIYNGEPWSNSAGQVTTMLAAGNGPDVFVSTPYNEVFIKNGWLYAIDDWVAEHQDEFVTLVTNYYWLNERNTYGHNYYFPDATMSRAIYYRCDWVEEIGYEIPQGKDWNWNAFWDLAEKLTDKEKNRYGFAFRGGTGAEPWAENYLLAYTGTYIYDPETLQWKAEEYKAGMKAYTDSWLNGIAPEESLNWGWAEQIDGFCSGLVGLFYNDCDCFPYIMERMEPGTWGVLPLPYDNEGLGVPGGINCTYSYVIHAATENPDACIGLMEFMYQPDRYVDYCMMMAEVPVRKDVSDTPYFSEDGPLSAFVQLLNNPDALLGGQLIGVNKTTWAGYNFNLAGEMQLYLLGETTYEDFFEAWREWNQTALDNYFAENPDAVSDIFRMRDVIDAAE